MPDCDRYFIGCLFRESQGPEEMAKLCLREELYIPLEFSLAPLLTLMSPVSPIQTLTTLENWRLTEDDREV